MLYLAVLDANFSQDDQGAVETASTRPTSSVSSMLRNGSAELIATAPNVKLDGGVEAKMCPTCMGLGIVHEEYNHRRMEKMCLQCEGQGVKIFKNGKEVEAKGEVRREDDLVVARRQKLEAELTKIRAKLSELIDEKASIAAGLSGSDDEGNRLKESLLQQLHLQIERLEKIDKTTKDKLEIMIANSGSAKLQ